MTRWTILIVIMVLGTDLSITEETDREKYREKRSGSDCYPWMYKSSTMGECAECPYGSVPNYNQTACEDCPKGTYRGTYSWDINMYSCQPCPAGKETARAGMSYCSNCRAGTYKTGTMKICEPCPVNTVSSRGAGECTPCREGTVSYTDWAGSRCVSCPENKYRDKTMTECEECTGGVINVPGSKCKKCPLGKYANYRMSRCETCADGTIPNPQRTACDGDKYYRKWTPVTRQYINGASKYIYPGDALEIKTNSVYTPSLWRQDTVRLLFFRYENLWVGAINIGFYKDKIKYNLNARCSEEYTEFPVNLTSGRNAREAEESRLRQDLIWRITVYNEADSIWILINCNGMEVLNTKWNGVTCDDKPSNSLVKQQRDLTMFKFSKLDTASLSYRFYREDVSVNTNPCPDNAHYCPSGQCWVLGNLMKNGKYVSSSGYRTIKCVCIIDGTSKDPDFLRETFNNASYYPASQDSTVQSIQCKEKHSYDRSSLSETKVTCGWYFSDLKELSVWNWGYAANSGLPRTVGTPLKCQDKMTWKIVLIILSSILFVIALLLIIWRQRNRGYCGSTTHQAIPSETPALETETTQPPSNPTIIRTASIPTYRECLDGSDRIVSDKDYVSLPTPSQLGNNDDALQVPPPTYEDVESNQDLYAIIEEEQENADV